MNHRYWVQIMQILVFKESLIFGISAIRQIQINDVINLSYVTWDQYRLESAIVWGQRRLIYVFYSTFLDSDRLPHLGQAEAHDSLLLVRLVDPPLAEQTREPADAMPALSDGTAGNSSKWRDQVAVGRRLYNPQLHKSVSSPKSHGLVVRAVACECEARGPGFESSSDQIFFFSSGIRRWE